jgi:dTDP-4-dehydrorhamnose reductase
LVATIKKPLKWMILGANGQLGLALQLEMQLNDCDFIALNHDDLDITVEKDVTAMLHRLRPNIVINSAAWTDVDLAEIEEPKAYLVNAVGPSLVASVCLGIGAKFIQISTDYVFAGTKLGPWAEDHPPSPLSAYGRTKADGERLVTKNNPAMSYIVRTAWLYSEYGNNFVKTMLKLAKDDSRIVEVVNDQIGQPTFAPDLAAQIYKMVSRELPPGIYHGTNSGAVSWYNFAREIFDLAGADRTRVLPVDSSKYPRLARRPSNSVLSHQHWLDQNLEPMRNWQEALRISIPIILRQMNREG